MEQSLRNELDSCISELRGIACALDSAAEEVRCSISGMSTWYYTFALEQCAESYRKAANKLDSIQ